jgi:mycoredoxin
MLKVYSADWCPHCQDTVKFLEDNGIDFSYIDIETQPEHVVNKVIEVNGGIDWVVPTLEYRGQWREGKIFDAVELIEDLKKMNVID